MDRGPSEKTLNSGLFAFTLPDHTSPQRDTVRELLVWPAAIPAGVRMLAFVVWTGLLVTLAALRVLEHRCRRRMLGLASTDDR